ncbi:DeoR/GlpR family DNA-binding transcription regulator [Clostridium ganghwense]|uniref:DeoR/GlpR family DNA-binding transcription regulator n=1 Tax=Clostridium ganghwense TaxID=312089 RepID=A0ABT4CPG2_9CLOT|nr:DeoR/GlpR family DNA-binding transcription regulator [Clostridium ganghwense]MCY6369869.1 DeoR/GlpR family DNA-binding transcription regulator [Clostridium ganghwense]
MFAHERIEQIINFLNKEGKVVVKELSSKFNVSEDCIRKDLKSLEKQGILKRTYGGAVLTRKTAHYNDIANRKNVHIEAKKKIAQKAFDLIEDRETIFLDISTTNILLAELISKSNKNITIVTNMIDIIKCFSNNNVKVIGIGGIFSKELEGFVGSAAIESIAKYKVDKAFVGSCGVNIFDRSITTFDVEDGNTKKAIINSGKKVYLVMESKKFYFDGTYKFADIYDINAVISDEQPNDDICNILKEADVDII